MLIEFTVGNFRSFKEPVTLSMVAAKLKARDPKVNENNTIKVDDGLTLLTSAAVYGANACGKSNLITAVRFMRNFVLGSSRDTQAAEAIDVDNFKLSTETEEKPSYFEVVFLAQGVQYRYGFEANRERILSEWLFYVPKNRESRLFMRHEKEIECARSFKEGKGLEEKTRANALFLSVVAQFNGSTAMAVLLWFKELGIISGLNDAGYRSYTVQQFENPEFREEILRIVKSMDLGILDVRVDKPKDVKTPNATMVTISVEAPKEISESVQRRLEKVFGPASIQPMAIQTVHTKYDQNGKPVSREFFDLGVNESEGTQKVFFLTGPLIDTLSNGRVLLIDEMEARMHPLITREIIGLFNSLETNPKRAQLIFTTHDTNLLSKDTFRRDQIWFIEKDSLGASHLYSLAELKVRNDASFETDYVQGRYGAIPFLGDLRRVVVCEDDEN
jgi:AAA15 family ATPase/GTPase